jgi:peptidoglycan DL-endopeptidase CwlO
VRPITLIGTSRRVAVVGLTALALTASIAAAAPADAVARTTSTAITSTTAAAPSSATSSAAKAYARTHPVLKYGSKGPVVRKVQKYVGAKVTGKFGAATRHRVKSIQLWAHLKANGVVDVPTWHAAYRFFTKHKKSRAQRLSPENIVHTARLYTGGPYRHGGSTPSGFDCSGYTKYVFGKLGVALPHQSGQQYRLTKHVSHSQMRAGDLLFFHHGSHIFHVAIYAGHGGLYHASHPGRATGYEKLWTSNFWVGRVR